MGAEGAVCVAVSFGLFSEHYCVFVVVVVLHLYKFRHRPSTQPRENKAKGSLLTRHQTVTSHHRKRRPFQRDPKQEVLP